MGGAGFCTVLCVVIATAFGSQLTWAQAPSNSCDAFAAAPTDINRSVPGTPFAALDAAAAIPACQEAVSSFPNVLRFKFQLARALNKAGRYTEAAALYEALVALGYGAAAYNLALLYFDGSGVIQNQEKAVSLLQQAAEFGYSSAQFQLGLFYATGQNVGQDLSKAREWYAKAAAQGNSQALNELGVFYENGLGVEKDLQKAAEYYEQSAEAGYVFAQNNLGRFYLFGKGVDRNPAIAAKWLSAAADQGSALAQNELGWLYQTGTGVTRDDLKAVELYKKSAVQNFTPAEVNLAWMYANGRGVSKDKSEALKWYAMAADAGHAGAQNLLGQMYQNGDGVTQDDTKAFELYKKSAAQGFAIGEANLGLMYANGRGVIQDKAEAAKWYATAADHGNAWAQNQLGLMYQNGDGVTQDDTKAFELYKKSAAQGFAIGETNLGWMYANGRGVIQDKAEAAKWYATAADHGNAWAQNQLGRLYQTGTDVSQDDTKAFELYKKSAAQGFASGEANLGWMYANGRGVTEDKAEAAKWYAMSAKHGDGWAMAALASMYNQGSGVSKDSVKAYLWYRLAVNAGNDSALVSLAELCTTIISPSNELSDLIRAGQSEAKEFLSSAPKQKEIPSYIDEVLRKVILSLPTATSRTDDVTDQYALEYTIAHDAFFSEHAAFAKDALVRTKDTSLAEAVDWYEKAIALGSIEAILDLANLYLSYDTAAPGYYYRQLDIFWSNANQFKHLVSTNPKQFIGSAEKAADLYEKAISRQSNAARINLATLYEIGLGVTRDLDKARSLYTGALGSIFDAKAQLGLLRIELNSYWAEELFRSRKYISALEIEGTEANRGEDISIEALTDYTRFEIRDGIGARIFSGDLQRGQRYVVSRKRNDLILWPGYSGWENLRIRIGEQVVPLPNKDTHYGVRLDRNLLIEGDYLVQRSDYDLPSELPSETIAQSRITLEGGSDVDVYVHSDDHVIGFHNQLTSTFHVPPVNGLTLELRPLPETGSDQAPPTITISIDGEQATSLTVPQGCQLTLALQPTTLRKITFLPSSGCGDWAENTSSAYVKDSSGNSIGFLKKLPNEDVPKDQNLPGAIKVIPGSLGINRGIALLALQIGGRWDEVLRAQKIFLSWDIRDHGPNSLTTLQTLLSLCQSEIQEDDVASARDHLDQAIERLELLGNTSPAVRIDFFRNFGSLLLRLARYSEAERFLMLANQLQSFLNKQSGNQIENDVGYAELSKTREKIGDLGGAVAYQLRVLLHSAFANLESSENYNKETGPVTWVRLIDLLNRTDRKLWSDKILPFVHAEAKREFARDLPEPLKFPLDLKVFEITFGPVDRSDTLATALGDLGQVYSWMGRHDEAIPLFEQVTRTRRNIFGEDRPEATAALATFANELRLANLQSDALAKAREAFSLAVQYSARNPEPTAADSLTLPTTVLLKSEYFDNKNSSAIDAFEVAQRIQGSAAAVALETLGARLAQSDPAMRDAVRRRQDLRQQVARLDADLVSAISSDPKFANRQDEMAIRQKIKESEGTLQGQETGRPSKLVQLDEITQPQPISYKDVKDFLDPDEALISFTIGSDSAFVFVATSDGVRWEKLDISAYTLERMVARLRCGLDQAYWTDNHCDALTGAQSPQAGAQFDAVLSYTLYRLLFAPIEDAIKSKPRLSFVLSGALSSLPPQVFVTSDPSGKMLQQVDWLVRAHAITVLPSIASLRVLRAKTAKSAAHKPLIGFADPVLDHNEPKLRRVAGRLVMKGFKGSIADVGNFRDALDPLPDTAKELKGVAAALGAGRKDVFTGAEATETRVKRSALEDYRIVYFATHALVADEVARLAKIDPEPAIVLSLPDHPTALDDGLLTASEAAQLKLDADWVVLSACNTASGGSPGAEPLSGLASAFFYAGARSLLVSHWEAEQESSARLMTEVFNSIAHNANISHGEALQKAMLMMIDHPSHPEWVSPSYWAPFVVVGEPGKRILH
jgi:TPR repeat protein/CHAT domain-containing protein